MMKQLFIMIFSLLVMNPCYAVEKASEKRLDEVAQRGAHVMPFDLELTTHVFSKTAKGGVQKVIVKNLKDTAQIRLIREHLTKISQEFQQANYSGPAKIHGENMPGLEMLRNAKPDQVRILYKDLTNGAEITYSTDATILITAIHQWFDAQLSDHARHATPGHSGHKRHNNYSNINNYGNFKTMIQTKNAKGVVNLRHAIPSVDSYAVGAIQQGLGEITVINGDVWLDYGKDHIGNSLNSIPADEKAALLVVSEVKEWQNSHIHDALSKEELFKFILEEAKEAGLDDGQPFPFMLEGNFNKLLLHVINGTNPSFAGPGGKAKLFYQYSEERKNQKATIIGFYSANLQGVYTKVGKSWHLHAVITDENIGAHVDGISTNENVILKLPSQK